MSLPHGLPHAVEDLDCAPFFHNEAFAFRQADLVTGSCLDHAAMGQLGERLAAISTFEHELLQHLPQGTAKQFVELCVGQGILSSLHAGLPGGCPDAASSRRQTRAAGAS